MSNKKCLLCGKIHSHKTDICDGCGGVSFVVHQEVATKKIGDIIKSKESSEDENVKEEKKRKKKDE